MIELADVNKAISCAKETIGLSDKEFNKLLSSCEVSRPFDAIRIPCHKFYALWKSLYLPEWILYSGYKQEDHLRVICRQIEIRDYPFKKSKMVRQSWKEFLQEQWDFESKHYGVRLRWKIRFKCLLFKKISKKMQIKDCNGHS